MIGTTDIRAEGVRNLEATESSNRALLERALRMRAVSYLAQQKARLLTQTIFEIDRSKQALRERARELEVGQDTIQKQKEELEARAAALEAVQRSLEERVHMRTAELEEANQALQSEATARERAQLERTQLNERYLRSQKLELVGRLAAGVAHDFNNLLTIVLGHGELLSRQLSDPSAGASVDAILEACHRGSTLTKQLLALAGKKASGNAVCDPGAVLNELSKLLQRVLGESVTLDLRVTNEVGNVGADASEIEQILLNLIVNARDAMPNGGTIMVSTSRLERPPSGEPPYGACVVLTVTDQGEGMSPEVLARAFEPFFTTKAPGAGTGLGLATVQTIVRDRGGRVEVESRPGEGTTFRVILPVVSAPSEPLATRTGQAPLAMGNETILVVDDDESVRKVLCEMLATLGYRVLAADRAISALRALAEHAVALLLVDSVMPGISGETLEAEVAKRWPSTRVLLMSGHTDRAHPRDARGQELPFIDKPIELARLAAAIRRILDGSV